MTGLVKQKHSGFGDNVAGNKVVQSLTNDGLASIIHNVYFLIKINSFPEVKVILSTLKDIPNKSLEVSHLLEVIEIYLSAKENKKSDEINRIKEIIRLDTSRFGGLYKSILVELTHINSKDDALIIYKTYEAEDSDYYLENIKYQFFSDREELEEVVNSKLASLDDLTLLSLAKGLSRVENSVLAMSVLDEVSREDEYLDILKLTIRFLGLYPKIDRPLIYIDKNLVDEFDQIASDFFKLIEEKKGLSDLSIRLLIDLVAVSNFSNPSLTEKALKFIEVIRPISSEVADNLVRLSEFEGKVYEEVLTKLNNLSSLSIEEASFVVRAIDSNKVDLKLVRRWVVESSLIEEVDEFYKDLLILILQSFVFKDEPVVGDFEKKFFLLLTYEKEKFIKVVPFYIKIFCENLYMFEKSQIINIYKLLQKILPENPCYSEIYLYFLYTLLHLEKYKILAVHIDRLQGNDNIGLEFLVLRARYYRTIKDYANSEEDYQRAVEIDKESLITWREYLSLSIEVHKLSKTKKILRSIPKQILKPKKDGVFDFIKLVYAKIDSACAEKMISKLFLMDPDFVAQYLLNIKLFFILQQVRPESNLTYENIYTGIVYEIENEKKQKLIVSDEFSQSSYFMSVDSEIGTALLEMVVNEERIIEYQKIKLLERQPVSVAIFQIALKIVKENRHNISQAKFIPFNVRVDSVIEDVEEILKRFLGNRHTEELICNSELPMYVKGEAFKRNEEFEVVLKILQNKKANWCLHTNPSVGNLIPNEAIVLDVYSFAYLCINNNYIGLIRSEIKVFISQETFDAITEWIEKVTDKNFLTVHLEKGGLVKTDASIAEIVYKPFIEQLNTLLSYAKVLSPNIIDLPDCVNEVREVISDSVFSTLRLSVANDLPWLCLDSALRGIFSQGQDVKVIQLHGFLELLSNHLDFNERKLSIFQWLNFGLFNVFFIKDLIELASSSECEDWDLLIRWLRDTPLSLNSEEQTLIVLSIVLEQSLFYHEVNNNLIVKNILKKLIFTCLNKALEMVPGEFRETRLAKLFIQVNTLISTKTDRHSKILSEIFSKLVGDFARGHFLNVSYINEQITLLVKE